MGHQAHGFISAERMHVGATWTVLEQFSTGLIGEAHASYRIPCLEQVKLLWIQRGYYENQTKSQLV